MGYRDDFYVIENIIGYTGSLHDNPTVYFLKDGTTFGRITQHHEKKNNIGRNKVRTKADYEISNGIHKGSKGESACCLEFYDGKVQHHSRHLLMRLSELSGEIRDKTTATLATAITRFPEAKDKVHGIDEWVENPLYRPSGE